MKTDMTVWLILPQGTLTMPLEPKGRLLGGHAMTGGFFFFFFFFAFLGLHQRHMEVPRLGVKSDLQLPAYTIATAMQDPSSICHLHHSS